MFDTIVSSGCSYAWGDELKDRNDRYSFLLAKLCDARLIDYSGRGASNEMISNSIINNVSRLISAKKINLEKTLVLVQWTMKDRLHYFSKSNNYYILSHGNMMHKIIANRKKQFNADLFIQDNHVDHIDLKLFYENHKEMPYLVYKMICNIHSTQTFLQSKGLKYVFCFASKNDQNILSMTKEELGLLQVKCKSNVSQVTSLPNIAGLLEDIDMTKIHPTSINKLCEIHSFKFHAGNHPPSQAHDLYSKELFNFVESLYAQTTN